MDSLQVYDNNVTIDDSLNMKSKRSITDDNWNKENCKRIANNVHPGRCDNDNIVIMTVDASGDDEWWHGIDDNNSSSSSLLLLSSSFLSSLSSLISLSSPLSSSSIVLLLAIRYR